MIDVENITRLADDDIQRVLKYVETTALIVVLSSASPVARERVLSALPNRARAMVQDDLDCQPPVGAEELAVASATFTRQLTEAVAAGDLPRRILEQLAS